MKQSLLFSALLGSTSAAILGGAPGWGVLNEIPPGFNPADPIKGVKGVPVPGIKLAPEVQEYPAQNFKDVGARRVKIRYGPMKAPGNMEGKLGLKMEKTGGLIWNYPMKNVKRPCQNCLITYATGGLEDQEGNSLNTNNGLWMHHLVSFVQGPTKYDPTCKDAPISLPHMGLYLRASSTERVFAFGNERTPVDFSKTDIKAGYHLSDKDKMHLQVEIMNTNPEKKLVWLTITYEFIPDTTPGFVGTKPIWLDADQCGLSEIKPPQENGRFTLDGGIWTSTVAGKILIVQTHEHDGGSAVHVTKNNQLLCSGKATYGGEPGWISAPVRMPGADKHVEELMNKATKHISDMGSCYHTEGTPLGELKAGDLIGLKGDYDYDAAPGGYNNKGGAADIMVISMMYIAEPLRR